MSKLLLLSGRQLPIVLGCFVICALMVMAYQRGHAHARQERNAYYSQLLAERDRAAAQASEDALKRLKREVDEAAALEREHLQAEIRRVQAQKVVTRVVKEYIDARPSLDHCRLDADGLRLWNARHTARGGSAPARRP